VAVQDYNLPSVWSSSAKPFMATITPSRNPHAWGWRLTRLT
jgi:pimeloyl-ACP methyl ester carboxylesterase